MIENEIARTQSTREMHPLLSQVPMIGVGRGLSNVVSVSHDL